VPPPPNLPQNSERQILGEASYFMEEIIALYRVISINKNTIFWAIK
jgi:hypothetical protein